MPALWRNAERLALVFCFCSLPGVAHAHAEVLQRELPSLPEYVVLGVEHILLGFDHLAFLLGLVLLTRQLRSVLGAVTAFTVAHSLSLAASSLGLLKPPVTVVETAIALSIAYVALQNMGARNTEARHRISFVFGFMHGFGFAGALQEIGLPADRTLLALLSFNTGVELGQLSVLCVLLPCLALLRREPRRWLYTQRALNVGLLGLGLFWATERALFVAPVALSAQSSAPTVELTAPDTVQLAAAARVCELFVQRPRVRRAECAGEAVGITLERACSHVLAGALARGSLELASDNLQRCAEDLSDAYNHCDLVRASALQHRDSCSHSLQGRLPAHAVCVSKWECREGFTCRGASPTQPGVCESGLEAQQPDALTAYLN